MRISSDNGKHALNISKRYLSKTLRNYVYRLVGMSFVLIFLIIACFNVDDIARIRTFLINIQMHVASIVSKYQAQNDTCINNAAVQYKQKLLDQLLVDAKEIADLKHYMSKCMVCRVVSVTVNDYTASVVINIGSKNGVNKDDYVVNSSGLIGRINEVSEKWSSVLLTTDLNSNIPVKFRSDGNMAIAQGDNQNHMRITMKNGVFDTKIGDSVVTSGYGGLYVQDIPVGTVDQNGTIHPCFDFRNLRFVCVIGHMPY